MVIATNQYNDIFVFLKYGKILLLADMYDIEGNLKKSQYL